MEFLEQELDINSQKIKNLETTIDNMHDTIVQLNESLKDTQRYLVKLAHNQMELTKRISQWPYIVVADKEDDKT